MRGLESPRDRLVMALTDQGTYWSVDPDTARLEQAKSVERQRPVDAWVSAVIFNLELPDGTLVAEMLVTDERLTDGLLLAALSAFARDGIPAAERGPWLERVDGLFRSIPAVDTGRLHCGSSKGTKL